MGVGHKSEDSRPNITRWGPLNYRQLHYSEKISWVGVCASEQRKELSFKNNGNYVHICYFWRPLGQSSHSGQIRIFNSFSSSYDSHWVCSFGHPSYLLTSATALVLLSIGSLAMLYLFSEKNSPWISRGAFDLITSVPLNSCSWLVCDLNLILLAQYL